MSKHSEYVEIVNSGKKRWTTLRRAHDLRRSGRAIFISPRAIELIEMHYASLSAARQALQQLLQRDPSQDFYPIAKRWEFHNIPIVGPEAYGRAVTIRRRRPAGAQ